MTNWAELIRNIMKEEKATQRRLEAASGVSRSAIKRALNGESPMRVDQLEKLLTTLGYTITVQKTGMASSLATKPKRFVYRARRRIMLAAGTWEDH